MTAYAYQYKDEPIHVATCLRCKWEGQVTTDQTMAEIEAAEHNKVCTNAS